MKKRERIEALEARMDAVELVCGLRELQPPEPFAHPATLAESIEKIRQSPEYAEEMTKVRTARPAVPEQPAYPWADGVDLTGGLVQCTLDGAIGKVDGDLGKDGWIVKWETRPDTVCKLSILRPAPRDWAVGDTALVVSTAGGCSQWPQSGYDDRTQYIGKQGWITSIYGNPALPDCEYWLALPGGGRWFHPSDLLYIPPADPPSFREPTATAEREMTAHLRDVMPGPRDANADLRAENAKLRAALELVIRDIDDGEPELVQFHAKNALAEVQP